MKVSLPVQEEQLGAAIVNNLRFLTLHDTLVVALVSQLAEPLHPSLVLLKLIKFFLESVDSILELVLLQTDLAQFPGSELRHILILLKVLRLEVVKGLMSDSLSKVDVFELFVEIPDALINPVIHHHARRHETSPDRLQLADVVSLLRQRHLTEATQGGIVHLALRVAQWFLLESLQAHFH